MAAATTTVASTRRAAAPTGVVGGQREISSSSSPEGRGGRPKHQQHNWDDYDTDICFICFDGGELLVCDTCPRPYHLHCHTPKLATIPKDKFQCMECVAIREGANISHMVKVVSFEASLDGNDDTNDNTTTITTTTGYIFGRRVQQPNYCCCYRSLYFDE
mmetsp:Transcript_17879/g.18069  ORF Transcript_17879/g.18069 Transcript_17879/m.18069 type:complete len:160 (-) Transcript_17879:784-1263(-)